MYFVTSLIIFRSFVSLCRGIEGKLYVAEQMVGAENVGSYTQRKPDAVTRLSTPTTLGSSLSAVALPSVLLQHQLSGISELQSTLVRTQGLQSQSSIIPMILPRPSEDSNLVQVWNQVQTEQATQAMSIPFLSTESTGTSVFKQLGGSMPTHQHTGAISSSMVDFGALSGLFASNLQDPVSLALLRQLVDVNNDHAAPSVPFPVSGKISN